MFIISLFVLDSSVQSKSQRDVNAFAIIMCINTGDFLEVLVYRVNILPVVDL